MKISASTAYFIGFICVAIIFSSCKYIPFIKYYRTDNDTNLPKFGKYSHLAGSNNQFRSCYDVTRYDWDVKVFPEKKSIEGSVKIWMDVVQNQDSLMFDFNRSFKLDSVVSRKPFKFKRKKDIIYVIFDEDLETDSQLELMFYYHGKPPNIIGEGPIVWKKDGNEKPWFSTQTEGLGVGYLFPCKDLLIDEPEECFISVNVPEGLETACNGKLLRTSTESNRTTTTWHVNNSINIYNISFNSGDFVRFKLPYESINGNTYDLEFYVLRQNEEVARKFYAQTPKALRAAEELFGEYPWWNDGLKFVESTFSAMEHQGCIAMGSDYESDWEDINTTLVHEIAHEWWGNSVTASDYSEIWLHEGLATYSENLVAERLFGHDNYLKYCRNQMYWGISNKRPVLKVPNVRYSSWSNRHDGDIYSKGSMLMHTLRTQMDNDELFFSILKDIQRIYRDKIISSNEFETQFLNKCECDLKAIFDVMLRQPEPPRLAYSVFVKEDGSNAEIKYRWTESVPSDYPLKIKFLAGDEVIILEPTHEVQTIKLPQGVEYKMQPWLSGYFLSAPFKS